MEKAQASRETSQHRGRYQKKKDSCDKCCQHSIHCFFEDDKLTINLKLKLIDTYIEPIFLHNSETWTLTKSMEDSINAFQRRIEDIVLILNGQKLSVIKIYTRKRKSLSRRKKKVMVKRLQ